MDLHKMADDAGVPLQTNRSHILYDLEYRKKVVAAANKINRAVGSTLGPFGHNAILDRDGKAPLVTKDGVTVLHDLEFADQGDQVIYEILRAQSDIISRQVGDGTTSIIWITTKLLEFGHQALTRGVEPNAMIKGMVEASQQIREILDSISSPARNEKALRAVLQTAANGEEEVIDTLVDVFLEVGDEGMIFVRDPRATHTQVVYEEGYVFPGKAGTPELLNPDTQVLDWEGAYVLTINDRVTKASELVPIFEDILRRGKVQNLILGYCEMTDEAMNLIHANNRSKDHKLRTIAFRMPLYTERQRGFLDDFAAFSDATVIDRRDGWTWNNIGIEQLGYLKSVNYTINCIRCLGGRGKEVTLENGKTRHQERLDFIKAQRDDENLNLDERNRFNERIAKMMGSVVAVCPGGKTDVEMKRKRGVYEDAILSGQSAVKRGIIPGGGWGLWLAADIFSETKSDDENRQAGYDIIVKACKSLLEKIVWDSGRHPQHTLRDIVAFAEKEGAEASKCGYDARANKVGNFLDIGVVDPVLLHDVLLEQATSTAVMLLSAGAMITAKPTEEYLKWRENQRFGSLKA